MTDSEAIVWLEEQIPDRAACSDPDCRCSTMGDPTSHPSPTAEGLG